MDSMVLPAKIKVDISMGGVILRALLVAGAEPAIKVYGAKLKKKKIGGAKITNFLKNRGKNYIFSFFF